MACEEAGHKLHFISPHLRATQDGSFVVDVAATPPRLLFGRTFYASYYLLLSLIYESCDPIFSSGDFEISYDRTGLTRSVVFWSFSSWFTRADIFMCSRDLTIWMATITSTSVCIGRVWLPGEHCRGVRVAERIVAHFRGIEVHLGSEVVFWVDERPAEFGHHGFDVAHILDHSPLAAPLADTEQYLLFPSPTLINRWSSWLITLTFFWTWWPPETPT